MESWTASKEESSIEYWGKQINAHLKIIETVREDKIQATKINRADNTVWNEDVRD